MFRHVGDPATQVAAEMRDKWLEQVANGGVDLDADRTVMEGRAGELMEKIRFRWRDSDRVVVEQIRAAADSAFLDLFEDCITIVDELYAQARVHQMRNGVPVRDGRGRYVWETDERGRPVEDWTQLDGTDVERALFRIQQLRFTIAPQLNELLMEAMLARHVYEDTHADAYSSVVDGTVGDRNAKANKVSRQDKYAAFYRYWLYTTADSFIRELDRFEWLLKNVRGWRIKEQDS